MYLLKIFECKKQILPIQESSCSVRERKDEVIPNLKPSQIHNFPKKEGKVHEKGGKCTFCL